MLKPGEGWQLSRARAASMEANTRGRGLKGKKMVMDTGTLGARIQSRLSAGLRLSPSKADLFLPLFTPSFCADTAQGVCYQQNFRCGVGQPCNKAKK